jgi:CRP/FNR family transcriptional regulator, anaerobic regulatory protein
MTAAEHRHRAPPPTPLPGFLKREVRRAGRHVRLEAGEYFLQCGQQVEDFALLLDGRLRVFRTGANGRKITLYGVDPGECCLINVLCLLAGIRSLATAVAEEPSRAVLFPGSTFLSWLAQRADVRSYVFGMLASRYGSMMALVEEVVFERLECRLAGYLCARATAGGEIALTHDAIAADLGTAREVVSRLLKTFERQGAVALARGSVTVTNPSVLHDVTGGAVAGRELR